MKFSVVICTYNYAHLLPDALKSVAAQTLQDFELVIVDDGSTDNTEEVAEEFRLRFEDFHYVKKPHSGPADSRNAGVRAARGTHIAFLDADDLWSKHYLAAVEETLVVNPQADLVLCEGIIIQSEDGLATGATLHWGLPTLCGPVRSPREMFGVIQSFSPSGMVFTKDLYNRIGPFDVESFGGFSEDIDWMFRALTAGASCACLKQRLYLYRRHDDNLTNKASDSFRALLKIYSKTLREARRDPKVEALARGIVRSHAVRFLPTCPTSEGRLLLLRAIETLHGDPFVRLCHLGTFVGMVGLLRFLKQIRQVSRRWFRRKLSIELHTSSEEVFETMKG
jgi:glycosyltransferase involved in cell wall biosynthesis